MYGMLDESLAEGIYAYGEGSSHPEFSLTQKIMDEDDIPKLKAYPRCILESGPKISIENGAEEVAEVEITITLLPDDNGKCVYDAIVSEVSEEIAGKWLKEFTPELMKKVS